MENNKTPERSGSIGMAPWIVSLIKGVVFAAIILIVFIAGCNISLDAFQETYGDALVPRRNVELTIDDVKYAIDTEDMSDAERLEYIRASIETLEEEIKGEEK